MTPEQLWRWLPIGWTFTVAIETPILMVALSRVHPLARRILCGLWLTACTYPVIILVLPALLDPVRQRTAYLAVAEVFAPVAECAIFALAFHRGRDVVARDRVRDYAAITAANLASFLAGECLRVVLARAG